MTLQKAIIKSKSQAIEKSCTEIRQHYKKVSTMSYQEIDNYVHACFER